MTTENTTGMYGYIAIFGDRRHELYANSLFEAREKALEHFKPRKRVAHMVTVVLAEKDGKTVTHRAVD